MVQMGLQSYLIADSLVGIVAQRLVRKICSECKAEIKPHKNLLRRVERWISEDSKFYGGKGCSKCNNTGYSGRLLISEILMVNETIAKMVADEASKYEIARFAQENEGFEPMIVDGLSKVLRGVTTLEEVLRVTKEM
jgi:general secretion pathway protein E/type IV pilus assembly protein PilB